MKKILFYINTLERGGAERVISNLANQFVRSGNSVYFITTNPANNEYRLEKEVSRINLIQRDLNNKIYKNFYLIRELRKNIKNIKPDVIISFLNEANFRSILAALGTNIPVIISVRNNPQHEYASKLYFFMQKILFPSAKGIVFQTKDAQSWFSEKVQKKSEIIMNQVERDFFETKHECEAYYCAVGRLAEQKNYKMMISAFAQFHLKYPDEKLFIYGIGPLEKELKDYIKTLDMENTILLKGLSDSIPQVLANAKAFIMTSNYEGMPNALLEAMAVGLPVVSTDCPCGGPKSIIKNGENGFLVPVNDETVLIHVLEKLQTSSVRREIGENAKTTSKKFMPEEVFKKWNCFIEEIINNCK